MKIRALLLGTALLTGCAHSDKATVWTEDGLTAAEGEWDRQYRDRATFCESQHKPETPEMEACFGEWYDADAKVETVIGVAVASLRGYWTARARGEQPPQDWAELAALIAKIVSDLPPPARTVFERVKGIK